MWDEDPEHAGSLRCGSNVVGSAPLAHLVAQSATVTLFAPPPPAMGDTPSPKPYKPTLFDRYGPDAATYIKASAWGIMVFGLTAGAIISQRGLSITSLFIGVIAGAVAGGSGLAIGTGAGWWWKRFAVDGTSTPYTEDYSYQQALVMKGQLAEALESFEAVIAERPDAVLARLRAAELYARDARCPERAAELFREARRIPSIGVGDDIYVTNRLVDLYTGPLATPGRAMVELRRVIDRYPGSAAAVNARAVLAAMKDGMLGDSG